MNKPLLLTLVLLLAGCATVSHVPAGPSAGRNQAYGLLYDLLRDESRLDLILIVKSATPKTAELIKTISETCDAGQKQMDDWKKQDASLTLDHNGLPPAEVETRASISKATASDLLSMSGPDFELRILLTQIQALNYGMHLTSVLSTTETVPQRKAFLTKLSARFSELRLQVLGRLNKTPAH